MLIDGRPPSTPLHLSLSLSCRLYLTPFSPIKSNSPPWNVVAVFRGRRTRDEARFLRRIWNVPWSFLRFKDSTIASHMLTRCSRDQLVAEKVASPDLAEPLVRLRETDSADAALEICHESIAMTRLQHGPVADFQERLDK